MLPGIQTLRSAVVISLALILGVSGGCSGQTEIAEQRLDGKRLSLTWSFETGGPIHQPPLRLGEVLVAVGAGKPLVALDIETGALRWKYDPPEGVWERAYAGDGHRVFVGVGGGQLVALDVQTGQVRWTRELAIDVQVPPLVDGEVLYVPTTFVGPGLDSDPGGRARLFALSTVDGRELWSFETGNYILQTPFLHEDVVYVAGVYHDSTHAVDEGGHTRLYALSAADGAVRWTYESEDGFPKSLYATDTVVMFIGYQDFVSGVDAVSGELRWRKDTGNWVPALAGLDNTIYFGSADTLVHALNVDTGGTVWQHNIREGIFNYVLGAPVRVLDDLYFLTQQGDLVALEARDGELLWEIDTRIEARVGLTVSGGWLFVGDAHGRVYAFTHWPG